MKYVDTDLIHKYKKTKKKSFMIIKFIGKLL